MACDGDCIGSVTLQQGPAGTTGTTGAQGEFGGNSLSWNFDTVTTGPGIPTSDIRLSSATLSSVTSIHIHDTNNDAVDSSTWLAAMDVGGIYGRIKVFKESDSSKFFLGTVTSVTDNTTYYTLGVTHVASNGTFTDDDSLVVSYVHTGASGATGSGSDGISVIQVNMATTQNLTNSFATGGEQSDTINGTTLDFGDVDDFLRMDFSIIGESNTGSLYDWKVLYGSDVIIDTFVTHGIFKLSEASKFTGAKVVIDLVVSATDTLIPVIKFIRAHGYLPSKFLNFTDAGGFFAVLPAVAISNPISGNNDLKIQLKNDDSSSDISIVSYELTKYLK